MLKKLYFIFLFCSISYGQSTLFNVVSSQNEDTSSGTPTVYLEDSDIKAFPLAEGWGKDATGGKGFGVFFVTNNNDSGPGSLRQAETDIEAAGGGNIIFRSGGLITLSSTLIFSLGNDNITFYGESASGDGVTIHDNETTIRGSNIIIRNLKFRGGDGAAASNLESLRIGGPNQDGDRRNIILSECSLTWGSGSGNLGINANSTNTNNLNSYMTVQNSIIAEGFNSKGMILYGQGISKISILRNIFSSNVSRNVRSSVGENNSYELINNYINYYWDGLDGTAKNIIDVVGNIWNDASTVQRFETIMLLDCSSANCPPSGDSDYTGSQMYINDNFFNNGPVTLNAEAVNASTGITSRINPSSYVPMSTLVLESYLLANVGARRKMEGLDPVDEHQRMDVLNRTGGFHQTEAETVGLPVINPGTPYLDSDGDGMEDSWEVLNGGLSINPNDILLIYRFNSFDVDQNRDVTKPLAERYTALQAFQSFRAGDWDLFTKE